MSFSPKFKIFTQESMQSFYPCLYIWEILEVMPGRDNKLVFIVKSLYWKFILLINFLSATDECRLYSHRNFVFIAIILSTLYFILLDGLQSVRKMQIYKETIACLFRRKISLAYLVWCIIFWIQNRALKCIDLCCISNSWFYKSASKGLEPLSGVHYRILDLRPVVSLLWDSSRRNIFD